MALTLSHLSALDVLRTIRSERLDVTTMSATTLTQPQPWKGKRWGKRAFDPVYWPWEPPSAKRPLHVLIPAHSKRVGMQHVVNHVSPANLPPLPALWVDEHVSIVRPELLFLQMSTVFSFPELVLLGYELCGNFSRSATLPLEGKVQTHIPVATSVDEIRGYLDSCRYAKGMFVARKALDYVSDYALSAPEAVLATIYSLPMEECGFNMGPIGLNQRVTVNEDEEAPHRYRFPDLLFPFAPVGINYDGSDHLDLQGIVQAVRMEERAKKDDRDALHDRTKEKVREVRAKVVDDNMRNRELMARGKIVLPVTKDDLYDDGLESLTRQILDCSRSLFGVDTKKWDQVLSSTENMRDRKDLLASMLPGGRPWGSSYGNM